MHIKSLITAGLCLALVSCSNKTETETDVDNNPVANNPPVASFNVENGATTREKILNAAASYDPDGDALTYIWSFSNASTKTTQTSSLVYEFSPGEHIVSLKVSDGSLLSPLVQNTLSLTNQAPQVAISNIQTEALNAELEIEFSDSDGDQVTVEWFVNDQSVGTAPAFNHDFSQAGDYLVKVVVTDQFGLENEIQTTVTVQEQGSAIQKPVASFTMTAGDSDREKHFDASGSLNPNTGALSYVWDFGDGQPITTTMPNTTYTFAPGNHEVKLTVMHQSVSSQVKTQSVNIQNNIPSISLSTPEINNLNVKIISTTNDADNDAIEVKWMLAGQIISTDQNLDYTFATSGTFELEAWVSDNFNGTSSATSSVIIEQTQSQNNAPTANFTFEINGTEVSFVNTSTDPDMDQLSLNWDFKNGQTSTQENPVITFAPGPYEVELTVTDNEHTVFTTKTITIQEVMVPITSFKVEAETFSNTDMDVQLVDGDTVVGYFNGGNYLLYESVNLTDIKSIHINYATPLENAFIEIRMDELNGPLLALLKADVTGEWSVYVDKSADLLINATGNHDVYVIGIQDAEGYVANLDYLEFNINSTSSVGIDLFELDEDSQSMCVLNGSVDLDHDGYTGSGFINVDNELGASVVWHINVTQAGVYELDTRFANGGTVARSGLLSVNEKGEQLVTLEPTSSWSVWSNEGIKVALEAGENIITFKSNSAEGLANIDKLIIKGDGITDALCPEIIVPGQTTPSLGCGKNAANLGSVNNPISIGSQGNAYYATLPANYNNNTPYSLVFVHHPSGGSGVTWGENGANFSADAKSKAIFVYPKAINIQGGWNGNDFQMFEPLYNKLTNELCVNKAAVFLTGYSSGGDFSGMVGCEHGDKITAIAPVNTKNVNGYPLNAGQRNCTGNVKAIVLHNPNDTLVGGTNGKLMVDMYREINHCSAQTLPVPGRADCVAYQGCDAGGEVTYCAHSASYGNPPTQHGYPSYTGDLFWDVIKEY
ncbi:PKD domain-containing protein [Marinicellulosiphila megalodicopiae]|uniref:PKD domain-containing protein n=1 Tax=Marinicellulosiphila megalodicopiae TaxID=2724896 RepID=UPI003BB0EABD